MVKIARFVLETKELFYFINSMTMLKRHCGSLEEARRIVAGTGIDQRLITV